MQSKTHALLGACLEVRPSSLGPSLYLYSRGCAQVWFKSDLRLDDHPGLSRARRAVRVQPVFCFDPSLYRALLRTPLGLQGLIGALTALRASLRQRGSNLLVVEGRAAEQLPSIAERCEATLVVAEEEVEFRWLQSVLAVRASLPDATELELYKASLFTSEPYSDDFRQFQSQRGVPVEPLAAVETLPGTPAGADLGDVPLDSSTLGRWRGLVEAADRDLTSPQISEAAAIFEESWGISDSAVLRDLTEGGEPAAKSILREYLASEGARPDVRDAIQRSETRATPLGSFPAIFSQAVALGTLSRRRVYQAAREVLNGQTRLQRLTETGLVTARSAAVTAEAADFHWHVAREDRVRDTKTGAAPRHWKWRGFLTDYFTADPEEYGAPAPDPRAPAFLLVHGFGAFGEQWRGQIRALAAAGHHVYAPTLPGYGRTEKPSLPYSQYLWVSFLRDFVVEVVRRPVVVAGNSIGGFIAASLAADYKQLVQGLVLFNSAGLVREGYKPSLENGALQKTGAPTMDPAIGPPGFVADLASKALLFYLEKTVSRTLSRVYPVKPEMADSWLCGEIARAAGDPGAQKVFRSVFYLPKPRALNYLVSDKFGGPTLILQGQKDPLQNARGRARSMERLCPNVRVRMLDAGHCPFDEQPEICNAELLGFIDSVRKTAAPPAELAATV